MGKKSAKRVKRAWAASRGGGNEKPSPVMALGGTCPQLPTPSDSWTTPSRWFGGA